MIQREIDELLIILKNIQEMLHKIVVQQAEEKGEKHFCRVCFGEKS